MIYKPLWDWLGVFLGDFQWFSNLSVIVLGWLSVICKISEISLVWFIIILYDSRGFKNHSEISFEEFLVILAIHKPFWNYFGVILSDSWWLSVIHDQLLGVIWGDSQWLVKDSEIGLGWLDVLSGSWKSLNFHWGSSWWLSVIGKLIRNFFGMILSEFHCFVNNFDNTLG